MHSALESIQRRICNELGKIRHKIETEFAPNTDPGEIRHKFTREFAASSKLTW